MGSVNLVVIVESMRSIIDHGGDEVNGIHVPSLIAVGAALGTSDIFTLCDRLNPSVSFPNPQP